jgi:hypothetical protein
MEGPFIIGLCIAGLIGLWLMTQKWAWVIALFLGATASGFACLASIIHFQILAALGFFLLSGLLWIIFSAIVE